MSQFLKFTLALFILGWGCVHVTPGTITPLSLPELASHAEAVIRGKVSRLSCQKTATGSIQTRIDVQVSEIWKGDLEPGPFTLVQAGGVLGTRRVVIDGQPTVRPGEDLLLFMALNERQEGVILSLWQGLFRVWQHPEEGEWWASNRIPSTLGPRPESAPLPGQVPLRLLRETVHRQSQP